MDLAQKCNVHGGPGFLGEYNSAQFSFPSEIYKVSLHLWQQSVHFTIRKNGQKANYTECLSPPTSIFQVFRGNEAILSSSTLNTSLLSQLSVPTLYVRKIKNYHCEPTGHILGLCVLSAWKMWSSDVYLLRSHLFTDLNTACLVWVQRSTMAGKPKNPVPWFNIPGFGCADWRGVWQSF